MGNSKTYIPDRFQKEVRSHLVLNFAEHIHYPLMLGIFGPPGCGKTFQLRLLLEELGVSVRSISASDLESERAGEPGKHVVTTYTLASKDIASGRPTAIVIDDFDTTVGEWENNTGTVNHQQVIAQIMHLADSPTLLERHGTTKRVPVFITGNDFSKLYPPLRRPGRMLSFFWSPSNDELEAIASRILDFLPTEVTQQLVSQYSKAPISFFTEIRVRLLRESCFQLVNRIGSNMKDVVLDPSRFKGYTLASFDPGSVDSSKVFNIAQQIIEVSNASNTAHLQVYRA
jgi:AAA+ superfamily predicted ATPase